MKINKEETSLHVRVPVALKKNLQACAHATGQSLNKLASSYLRCITDFDKDVLAYWIQSALNISQKIREEAKECERLHKIYIELQTLNRTTKKKIEELK